MKKPNHYVDNEKLYNEMVKYKQSVEKAIENGDPKPKVNEYIGSCILAIANGYAEKANYRNYPFIEDMVMVAVENCLKYIDNYDYKRFNNPFAYFSRTIQFAFWRMIKDEKKLLYRKFKHIEHVDIFSVWNNEVTENDTSIITEKIQISEHTRKYMEDFIQDHESKLK